MSSTIERLRGNRALATALSAITAAVVGVVLNLAVWFAINTAFDEVDELRLLGARLLVPIWSTVNVPSVLLAGVAALAIFRFNVGVMKTLAGSAALGLLVVLTVGA